MRFQYAIILGMLGATAFGAEDCPTSFLEWEKLRTEFVKEWSEVSGSPSESQLWIKRLEKCEKSAAAQALVNGQVEACLAPIKTALRSVVETPAAPNDFQFPKEFQRAQWVELLKKADQEPEALKAEITRLKKIYPGMVGIPFASVLNSTDPHRARRILFYVPGLKEDRWINFAFLPNLKGEITNMNVSMVRLNKRKNPPEVEIEDFLPVLDGKKKTYGFVPRTTVEGSHRHSNSVSSCYECHKMGPLRVLEFSPEEAKKNPVFPLKGIPSVDAMNASMPSTGLVAFKDFRPEDRGPALGPVKNRAPKTVATCVKKVIPRPSKAQIRSVQEAMNCASCHDGKTLNGIYPPFNRSAMGLHRIVVERGRMPPSWKTQSKPLREALFQCLMDEYFSAEKSPGVDSLAGQWFLRTSCEKSGSAAQGTSGARARARDGVK